MTTLTTLPEDLKRSNHAGSHNHPHGVLGYILRSLEGIYLQVSGPGTTRRDRLHSEIARKPWL